MRKRIVTAICLVALLSLVGLGGCSAGACYICGSEGDTSSYTFLATGSREALCTKCLEDALGSPDKCAWCEDDADGFYVNLLEIPVFSCQDCYDGI